MLNGTQGSFAQALRDVCQASSLAHSVGNSSLRTQRKMVFKWRNHCDTFEF